MADTKNDASFPLTLPRRQILFDIPAFDRAIAAHGVKVVHYRAMRCPGGLTSREDWRRPHEDHNSCQGGFLFKEAGQCFMIFTSNSSNRNASDIGLIVASGGFVTFTTAYDNGQPVRVAKYDRLYLPETPILVETWELFDHNVNGIDRLDFPVVEVIDLVSSSGKSYNVGDFQIVNGKLQWSSNRPIIQNNGRGETCAIRYRYRPYWIVSQLQHELRLATKVGNSETGNLTLMAVQQAAFVQRENIFASQDNNPETPSNPRKVSPPPEEAQFSLKGNQI